MIKTDSNGDLEWQRAYKEFTGTFGKDVLQTKDEGYVVIGDYRGDILLMKTDSEGNFQWSKTFGGDFGEQGNRIQRTADGGYVIVGHTYSYNSGSGPAIYLVKTDSNGNMEWNRTFEEGYEGRDVQQTKDGGYVIIGNNGSRWGDIVLIKTDSKGNLEWNKTLGGEHADVAYSGQQTSDGGYVITGYTELSDPGGVYLGKTDSNGEVQWQESLGMGKGYSIQQTSDGGYIISGTNEDDVYVIKLSAGGHSTITPTTTSMTSSSTQTGVSSSIPSSQTETPTESSTAHTHQTTTSTETGFHTASQSPSSGTIPETSGGFSFNATCGPGAILLLPLLPLLWRKRRG